MSTQSIVSHRLDGASGLSGEALSLPCWCGGGPWREAFRTPRFGLLECTSCGCHRIDPPPLFRPAESANFYNEYYREGDYEIAPIPNPESPRGGDLWEIAASTPRVARVGQRALDFGCGDGHRCSQLKAAGWPEVIGFDISESRLKRARRAYPSIRLESRPPAEWDIEPGSIDLLVMEHIVEHFPEPLAELRAIRPLMAPDSSIVLSTPNIASGHFRVLGRRWTGMLAPHAHIFLFSPATLALLLEKAGFETLSAGSLQKPLYSLRSFLQRIRSGDVRGATWRIHQELGTAFGRLIGAGPIAYAVARPQQPKT